MMIKPSLHPEALVAVNNFYQMACKKYPYVAKTEKRVLWEYARQYVHLDMQLESARLIQSIMGGL